MPSAPTNRLVIALAQIPAIVGDIAGNRDRLRNARAEAAAFGADIVMAPELYLSGYAPRTWCSSPRFRRAAAPPATSSPAIPPTEGHDAVSTGRFGHSR
jgi:NAD+ synthase